MKPYELTELAKQAMERSYSPYSQFRVGAALESSDGKVWLGCNIENASYSPTLCAERCAFAKAVSEGERDFDAIAIVGSKKGGEAEFTPPCGVCRQVMTEFCDPQKFRIYMLKENGEIASHTLAELIPLGFGKDNLV